MIDDRERYYIKEYNSTNRDLGYNRDGGGSLNKHISEESRRKISLAKKGKYTGKNNPMYGVHLPCSEEKKKKLSEFMKIRNAISPPRKHVYTQEERQRMSERSKGEKNPFYGRKHSEETKQKIIASRRNRKAVRCIETKVEYRSAYDAQLKTKISNASIHRACKNHLTAGGYHWEYVV